MQTLSLLLSLLLVPAHAKAKDPADEISAKRLLDTIKEFSSDYYEGRGPGTRGEERSLAYLTKRFKEIGLAPGNPDGTYFQKVPLIGFSSESSITFRSSSGTWTPSAPEEYVAASRLEASTTTLTGSELLFVGYGVKAPEYQWDDYKGTDVRGKTLVMLVNDPAIPDPKDPAKLDDSMFKGKAMTYYGRWTYKYEIASELGADGALIIHETGPAGYPFEVVQGSFNRELFDLRGSSGPRVALEGWISSATARRLLASAGQDFDALKAAALKREFKPVPLGIALDATVKNTVRRIESANVVARLEGSDPKRKDEHVIYSAHWDHLGIDPKTPGDDIWNGAIDNGSGVAALLEMANAFKRMPRAPARSILFLATTAEEKGLLGARYYAEHPLYPLNKTLAVINMDSLDVWAPTRDLVLVGLGMSTLDDHAAAAAKPEDKRLMPDPEPEKGYYFRSDHFPFVKAGVPALDVQPGIEAIGKPAGWGLKKREEYVENDYHKPSDEVKPDWDLSGMAQDLRVLLRAGRSVADADRYPEWRAGSEFKAIREESLKTR